MTMRTALIAAILFAALLNCAYSAPQPQPDEDTEAVLQELQSVLEQGGSSTPAPTQFLCRKSGNAEAQFLGTDARNAEDVQQARDQWLNRKNVGKALKVANAVHRAWNDQQLADAQGNKYTDVQQARDQWLNRKNVGKALKVANAVHRAWNDQQLADAQGANQELAVAQGAAAIVNFSCTPVKVNSNGEVTFLDLE